jgi:hypothetical protein
MKCNVLNFTLPKKFFGFRVWVLGLSKKIFEF